MAGADPAGDTLISVEVAYATAQQQVVIPLRVPAGSTLGQAIARSGILQRYPEIDLQSNATGVFGHVAKLEEGVRDGDRIEIYRALVADPKQARRRRAASKKNTGGRSRQSG